MARSYKNLDYILAAERINPPKPIPLSSPPLDIRPFWGTHLVFFLCLLVFTVLPTLLVMWLFYKG